MNLVKMLIGVPLLVVLFVFAFVNNDLATFSLWPFYMEMTVSLSVAIIFLFFVGFLFGSLFTWMSYAPELHQQKKENKKLCKAQKKLSEKVSGLQDNLNSLTTTEQPAQINKMSNRQKLKALFRKKEQAPSSEF